MAESPLVATVVFHVGPVPVTEPVVTTWGIMAALVLISVAATRRLAVRPRRGQAVLEIVVSTLEQQIGDAMRAPARRFLPLLGTLFIYLAVANLCGVLPGVHPPTAHIETTAALALIVFLSTQYYGVRSRGLAGYLGSFARPTILMFPLNVLSEITRTFSLMVRLFGNVMSGEFVIAIVLSLAGLFVPVPLMALEILTGLVQAYIFTVLAAVFIGAATGSIEKA
ncbi:MAG TPA: F0F1 ATP synthase subunit A [Stellaceae bacterium]|nr:F0F1 ATP synthase subunit A [Stellaceae bacterium]